MVLGEVEFGKLWLKKQGNIIKRQKSPRSNVLETQYNSK